MGLGSGRIPRLPHGTFRCVAGGVSLEPAPLGQGPHFGGHPGIFYPNTPMQINDPERTRQAAPELRLDAPGADDFTEHPLSMNGEAPAGKSVRNGKGGRKRVSPIIGKDIQRIVERMENTPPKDKVWQYVNSNADIHAYRADYATAIYKAYARPIEDIPYDKVNKGTGRKYQSEVYSCRKDEAGKKLDKAAMLICSKALGHNRISVVADYYIRGL